MRAEGAREELWRRRLAEFSRSRGTVAEFCRRAGVSPASFYAWRRRLSSPEAPAPSFLPVELTGLHRQAARSLIKVLLPNGARVLVPSEDQEALRAVLATVASLPSEARRC